MHLTLLSVLLAVLLLFFVQIHAITPTWSFWGDWTVCSKPCGKGWQTRRRTCKHGITCIGVSTEKRTCNAQLCYGEWSGWSSWTACDKPCAVGWQNRTRLCNGAENCLPVNGGLDRRLCNTKPCPLGDWSLWSEWTECSKTCVGGQKVKERICQGKAVGVTCPGSSVMSVACGTGVCTQEGFWQSWMEWSACTKTCGGGIRRRFRICIGGTCRTGENKEEGSCNTEECPGWSEWDAWSDCSATCGPDGRQTRSRVCQGSFACIGEASESRLCNTSPCPVLNLPFNVFSSKMDIDSILQLITNLFTSLLQNPGNLFSSLGLQSGGGNGLPSFGNLIGSLLNVIPMKPRTRMSGQRSTAEVRGLLIRGVRKAYNKVKVQKQKNNP